MVRKRQPRLVRFEEGIHWLVAKLAAEKAGLSKPDLARRAMAGEIRFQANKYGVPCWYAEPDIIPLRKAFLAKQRKEASSPRRQKSLAQLETEWRKGVKSVGPGSVGPSSLGPVSSHLEKLLLMDIFDPLKKEDD